MYLSKSLKKQNRPNILFTEKKFKLSRFGSPNWENKDKSINNGFIRSDVSRCEQNEQGLTCEGLRHKSRRARSGTSDSCIPLAVLGVKPWEYQWISIAACDSAHSSHGSSPCTRQASASPLDLPPHSQEHSPTAICWT